MKKLLTLALAATVLFGCSPYQPLTNEQIVKEVEVCRAAHLDYKIIAGDFGVARVECSKPGENKDRDATR